MEHKDLRQKIINDLDQSKTLNNETGESLIETIAKKYNTDTSTVEKVIAEWEAGHGQPE